MPETINTEWGIAHVLQPALMADGSPGWFVVLRRSECNPWPFLGDHVFKVVAQ